MIASVRRMMRATARSRSIVACVPLDLTNELHEASHDSENQEHDIEEIGVEGLVQQIANRVTDEGGGGQEESQAGVFADHRHGGLLALHACFAANRTEASWTSRPILGWL